MALIFHRGGLGGVAPSSDSIDLTDDSLPRGSITIGPTTVAPAKKAKGKRKAAAVALAKSTGTKVALKRAGSAGSILDKILPLKIDQVGKKTIFGLPPPVIYIGGGIAVTTILWAIVRALTGGGRRYASNPKRARGRRR